MLPGSPRTKRESVLLVSGRKRNPSLVEEDQERLLGRGHKALEMESGPGRLAHDQSGHGQFLKGV